MSCSMFSEVLSLHCTHLVLIGSSPCPLMTCSGLETVATVVRLLLGATWECCLTGLRTLGVSTVLTILVGIGGTVAMGLRLLEAAESEFLLLTTDVL